MKAKIKLYVYQLITATCLFCSIGVVTFELTHSQLEQVKK